MMLKSKRSVSDAVCTVLDLSNPGNPARWEGHEVSCSFFKRQFFGQKIKFRTQFRTNICFLKQLNRFFLWGRISFLLIIALGSCDGLDAIKGSILNIE